MSELLLELQGDSALNYGKYSQQSTACTLCMSEKHNEINLMRVKKHMKYKEISDILKVSEKLVRKHFESHFIATAATQRVISLSENTSQESRDIINHILDGNMDFHTSIDLLLKSKAERLIDGKERLKAMKDQRDSDSACGITSEEDDTLNWCKVNKVVEDLEKGLQEAYKLYKQELLPMDKTEMANAILSFKLNILQTMLDRILSVFIGYENTHPQYSTAVNELKSLLSIQFNNIELDILKSGGRLANDNKPAIETAAVITE